MSTYKLTFEDLGITTTIVLDLRKGMVCLYVDEDSVEIPLETFDKIVERFNTLLDGGYT